jgi:hypothetical protein
MNIFALISCSISVTEMVETLKQKDDQIERLKNILAKKMYKIRSLKQRLIEANNQL